MLRRMSPQAGLNVRCATRSRGIVDYHNEQSPFSQAAYGGSVRSTVLAKELALVKYPKVCIQICMHAFHE